MPTKLYKRFHHINPDKIERIKLEIPKILTKLGKVVAIEYICSEPSEFEGKIYKHEFKKRTILATDGKNLYIFGVKITKRGIEDR